LYNKGNKERKRERVPIGIAASVDLLERDVLKKKKKICFSLFCSFSILSKPFSLRIESEEGN